MPGICRVRVCAIGSESDMICLNRVLLENVGEYEEPDDRPPYSLKELHDLVVRYAVWEKGEGATMVYGMICPRVYGHVDKIQYELLRLDNSLYAALFTYECADGLQQEDWLRLHLSCNKLPMFAIYASEELAMAKGEMILSNGQLTEDWRRMAQIWFYLMEDYAPGLVEDDASEHLRKLDAALRFQGFMPIDQLLTACRENLISAARGTEITGEMIDECVTTGNAPRQLALQRQVADAILWDSARNARRLACLDYHLDIWAHREDFDNKMPLSPISRQDS